MDSVLHADWSARPSLTWALRWERMSIPDGVLFCDSLV